MTIEDIKRYRNMSGCLEFGERESPTGVYVKYDDHKKVVDQLQKENESLRNCGNCKYERVDVHNSMFGNCDDPCFTCTGLNLWEQKREEIIL